MRSSIAIQISLVVLALCVAVPEGSQAQAPSEADRRIALLEAEYPELYDRLVTLERAHGVLFGGLFEEGEEVRAAGDGMPTFDFEFDMFDLLIWRLEDGTGGESWDAESDAGYAVLGDRGVEVIRRTHAFHRELLGIYVDPEVTDRAGAVDQAVDRYLSRPEVALPSAPKDMDTLYDHPYTWAFKTGYLDLNGFIWSGNWLQLAAFEPMMEFGGREERLQGLETVTDRFHRKLSFGEPPDAFPTELPLAPPIAPGLVARHPRAAAIIDNLNMMNEVLADVLVSPDVADVRAALDEVIDQFTDPGYRVVSDYDWMLMALRHSIFNQGGPALGTMTQSERNASGHTQHLGGGGNVVLPGMPR